MRRALVAIVVQPYNNSGTTDTYTLVVLFP